VTFKRQLDSLILGRGSTAIGSIARQQQCNRAAIFIVLNLWIFFYEVG